jgi:hypothetical protein
MSRSPRLRVWVILLLAFGLNIVATPASAHGTCTLGIRGPWDVGSTHSAKGQMIYDCHGSQHSTTTVRAQLQKLVSGSWEDSGNGVGNSCYDKAQCQATDTEPCSQRYWRVGGNGVAESGIFNIHSDGWVWGSRNFLDCN